MAFRAADYDSVRTAFHDMHVHVRVRLLRRRFRAVAFGVGHGAVYRQVVVLHEREKLLKVLVIMRPVFLINFIRARKDGVEGIHAYATLETGRGFLSQKALHFDLVHQVLSGLVKVGKAVNRMPREAGFHRHEVLVFGVLRQRVSHGHAVNRRANHGMVHPVFDFLPEHIHAGFQFPQGINVFLRGFQCHCLSSCFPPVRLRFLSPPPLGEGGPTGPGGGCLPPLSPCGDISPKGGDKGGATA